MPLSLGLAIPSRTHSAAPSLGSAISRGAASGAVSGRPQLLTASSDRTAKLWSGDTGECLATFAGHKGTVCSATFSADGNMVLTAGEDGARLWSRDGHCATSLPLPSLHGGSISHDGALVFAAADGIVSVVRGDEIQAEVEVGKTVFRASRSSDGRILAATDTTAQLFSEDGDVILELSHDGLVFQAAFSKDERSILTASADGTARLWCARSGECRGKFSHDEPVNAASLSADGSTVLTASDDGTAKVWRATGECLKVIQCRRGPVNAAALSADGSYCATAGGAGVAELWCVSSGQRLQIFSDHEGGITDICLC